MAVIKGSTKVQLDKAVEGHRSRVPSTTQDNPIHNHKYILSNGICKAGDTGQQIEVLAYGPDDLSSMTRKTPQSHAQTSSHTYTLTQTVLGVSMASQRPSKERFLPVSQDCFQGFFIRTVL